MFILPLLYLRCLLIEKQGFNKIELHCHLAGLLCPEYLRSILASGFHTDIDVDRFQAFYPITDLVTWNRLLDYQQHFILGQGELLLEVLKLHLQVLHNQQVRYVEIMLDSFLNTPEPEMAELMTRYRSVANTWQDIDVGFLGTVSRTQNQEKFRRKVDQVRSLWEQGFVDGLAVAGNEEECKIKEHADVFKALSEAGMPVEIHAGETTGPEYIWDAIEFGHARRIGHALSIFEDPQLVSFFSGQRCTYRILPHQ